MNRLHLILGGLACCLLSAGAFAQASPKSIVKQGIAGRLYTPGPFETIELSGSANVRLLQGSEDQVFIAGDAQAQEAVTVTVSNGRLDIRSIEGWKMWPGKRLQVEVSLRRLHELVLSGASDLHAPDAFKAGPLSIRISGAGSVRFDDLWAERLDFTVSGAGDGYLRGGVNLLDLRISGKGKLLAENLHAESANIKISGIGSAEVWVSEKLSLNISGVGQVDYWGQPTVSRTTSGIAKVNGRGDRRAPPAPPVPPAAPAATAAPAVPAQRSPSQ
jgi:hypothetical protein